MNSAGLMVYCCTLPFAQQIGTRLIYMMGPVLELA